MNNYFFKIILKNNFYIVARLRTSAEKGSTSKFAPTPPTAVAPPSTPTVNSFSFYGKAHGHSGQILPKLTISLVATAGVPDQEELDELLKHFPLFTDMESPVTNMNDLFPANQWIPIEVDSDRNILQNKNLFVNLKCFKYFINNFK